jgi:diadenosine tetraphosphatase ApaH/serine/threonine PP2A family protein phosphatase
MSCSAAAVKTPARDWLEHPAIVQFDTSDDVYALGDIHGDYDTLVKLLAGSGIISKIPDRPQEVQWTAGKSMLVCTGDLIDRFNQSLQVIACLRALQSEAGKAGGKVIITLGNHEAVFLATAGHDKINDGFDDDLKVAKISPKEVAAGRDAGGIGQFFLSLPAGARINDWFFCHAGNTHSLSMKELIEQLQAGIDEKGFAAPILNDPDSMLQARMHPRPWWEASDTPALKKAESHATHAATAEKHLRDDVEALGVKHLVFGHQPGAVTFADKTKRPADEIFTKFDGLVFMIDTGMSRGVDSGVGTLLKIHQADGASSVTTINSEGKSQPLWYSAK